MWKAKNGSTGSSSTTLDSQSNKHTADSYSSETGPSKSFKNFHFDTASIFRAMGPAFVG